MKATYLLFFIVWYQVSLCYGSNPHDNFKIFVNEGSISLQKVTDVKNMLANDTTHFISLEYFKDFIGHSEVYWLYLKPESADTSSVLIVSLNERFSKIALFPYPYKYSTSQSGLMVPLKQKSLSGASVFLNTGNGPFLIKVENCFQVLFKINDIRIMTFEEYLNTQKKNNLFQGFAQGFFWLMLLYNLVLFFISRNRIHLYYVIYIFFNALFLLFTSGFSEVFLFPGNYRLNLILLTFQLLGVFFYVLFLRIAMLAHCTDYTSKSDRYLFKPFAFLILVVNAAIGSTVFYRMDLYTLSSSISNILSTLVGMILFGFFYRKSDRFMRLIMIGSVILFVLGYVNVLYTFLYRQTEFFYTAGLLIELMVLTYALNRQHYKEQSEVEHKNRKLATELATKNRELVNIAIQLSAKAAVLASVREKLVRKDDSEEYRPLCTEIDLADKATDILWKDFEKHFNETHPGFYRNLTEEYPLLTTNEIRLCAFLKLNLNTKEIAMITLHSVHSIEAMRSRIRQKLKLGRDGSLTRMLSRL
jgi:DNA-binding CsgD family transcriptional regulator